MDDLLDRAFGHPRGLLGRLGGLLMSRGNAATERQVVDLAGLTGTETVLVVGPGPGIGLQAAAHRAAVVLGVDPSEEMLRASVERCSDQVRAGTVRVRVGTAEATGLEAASVDAALSVNNVQLWDDRAAGFAELARVVRPGGRLVLSSHEKWLPVSRHDLAAEAESAGFVDVQTWTWDPPGSLAGRAVQLRAQRGSVRSG